jgi:hypothetical protein
MSLIDLDLNPRVRNIIQTALKEAKPIWLGLTEGEGGKEIWERRALWMLEIEPNLFHNGNSVSWVLRSSNVVVGGCVLSVTPNGAPFQSGPLRTTRYMAVGDTIVCAAGAVILQGTIPQQ